MKKINEITANQNNLELMARIERVSFLTGPSGQNYLSFVLVDRTGRLEARKWSVQNEDKECLNINNFIYLKNASTTEYRGQLQLKITEYEIIDKKRLELMDKKIEDFYISAPISIPEKYEELLKIIKNCQNKIYKTITLKLLEKYKKQFVKYPAAMYIHHNVLGGLFWHSYSLVKNILAIYDNYQWATIDWDLLICGAVLHDIGKVIEILDISGSDYSLEGKMLGHISIGKSEISLMAKELGYIDFERGITNKSVTLLEHLVLASHGKHEFGSPIEPLTIEGIILSTFDNLDARIYRVNEEINKVDWEFWTPRIPSENNSFFFNHFKKPKK